MRGTWRLALLLALYAAASGCSAIVAAITPDDDLSVLLRGAPRSEIEREFGRPEWTADTDTGLKAAYRVRIGQKRTWGDNVATVTRVGLTVLHDVGQTATRELAPVTAAVGAVLAVPAMVATDFVMSVKTLAGLRKRRHRVVVLYDDDQRVLDFRLGPNDS